MKLVEARAGPIEGTITPLSKRLVLQCNIETNLKKSTRGSAGGDLPRLDMEARSGTDAVKQDRLGRGHPHLATPFEAREQGLAPLGIEVRGDFVEKQDRRLPAPLCDDVRVSEHQSQQQRFLLTRRRPRSRHLLRPMLDSEVVAVRPFSRSAGGGIARTVGFQQRGQIAVPPTVERNGGARENLVFNQCRLGVE